MRVHGQHALVGLSTIAVVLLTTACSPAPGSGDVVVEHGQTIKVGVGASLTGPLEGPGKDILHGIEIATAEYNELGGVQGFNIELIVEEDGCSPDGGREAAQRLAANPEVVAVIGHVCSGASLAAAEVYQEARIPMVSSSSTSPALTALGYDVVNRTAWNDNIQGLSSARYAFNTLGVSKVAILHDNDAYGLGLAQVFQAEFAALGGEVSLFRAIDVNQTDYRPMLSEIAASGAEMVFFGGYDDQAILLVQQMQEMDLDNVIFFSDDGTYTQEFLEGAGEAAEGTYASFASPPIGVAEALNAVFDKKYEELYGQAPDMLGPFHAHAHDAATIVFNAIAQVARTQGRRLVINREQLITAVRDTRDYRGLTGTLTCDERGECGAAGEVAIVQVVNAQWVEVER